MGNKTACCLQRLSEHEMRPSEAISLFAIFDGMLMDSMGLGRLIGRSDCAEECRCFLAAERRQRFAVGFTPPPFTVVLEKQTHFRREFQPTVVIHFSKVQICTFSLIVVIYISLQMYDIYRIKCILFSHYSSLNRQHSCGASRYKLTEVS